jgi:hypothetical protein
MENETGNFEISKEEWYFLQDLKQKTILLFSTDELFKEIDNRDYKITILKYGRN